MSATIWQRFAAGERPKHLTMSEVMDMAVYQDRVPDEVKWNGRLVYVRQGERFDLYDETDKPALPVPSGMTIASPVEGPR